MRNGRRTAATTRPGKPARRAAKAPKCTCVGPLKAVASTVRLDVLHYLKDPASHFPAQVDGDLVRDGVCSGFICEKLGIAPATASRHLKLLTDAELLIATRKKGWTFYRRDEKAIRRLVKQLDAEL
jgi:DNA-binding transcriptional ArsR family regulator